MEEFSRLWPWTKAIAGEILTQEATAEKTKWRETLTEVRISLNSKLMNQR
jgi:hypothetical protein